MSSDMTPYAGRWVALVGDQVIGVGSTADEALRLAEQDRAGKRPIIRFIDAIVGEELPLPPLMARLRPILAQQQRPIYLVGGAVRDALLGRASHDLDFVVPQHAINLAFQIADALDAPAYVLDRERDTGRVVLPGQEATLDFARFRGSNLEADLRDRDFTVNAMAIPATSRRVASLIDPCGGTADLAAGRIQQTHARAIIDDPVRSLRALRLSLHLNFALTEETAAALIDAGPALRSVSSERIRDELQKLLQTAAPAEAISQLDRFGLLEVVLPEIAELRDLPQSAPHHEPVFDHTISVLRWLSQIEAVILSPGKMHVEPLATVQETLATYAPSLESHLAQRFDGGLDGRTVLRLAALFHDAGKKETFPTNVNGVIRYLGHEQAGAALAVRRLRQLCLSNQVIARIKHIVAGHMRPMSLANHAADRHHVTGSISRRVIYRFFRQTGPAGIDICILSLADHLATHDGPGDVARWHHLVKTITTLLYHYFEQHTETISPPPLLNGYELMQALQLESGPEIGRLLRLIQEAQAAGEISTQPEAIQLARQNISATP